MDQGKILYHVKWEGLESESACRHLLKASQSDPDEFALVRASQFLQQFKLEVRHKPGNEHIIPDALSRLASANAALTIPHHSEFDALFVYNATLIEIHPALVSRILAGYDSDPWWARLQLQVQANRDLDTNAATLLFVLGIPPPTEADPHLALRPENATLQPSDVPSPKEPPAKDMAPPEEPSAKELLIPDKTKLLYHVNRLTGIHRLCIPPSVAPDIIAIAHGEGHPGFARCYEIVTRSWFIRGLTKLLCSFIRHCPQCLVLQTRRHPPFGSLQPIESPPVPFFTLTLDFILALPMSKEGYNALMSVTCKFSKRVTLIKGVDT